MVDILVQSYTGADSPTIPISIAAYVDEHGQSASPLAHGSPHEGTIASASETTANEAFANHLMRFVMHR